MRILFSLFVLLVLPASQALAAGDVHHPHAPGGGWTFDAPVGTFDRNQLQRGLQVYKQVCAACHGLNLLSYRNLKDLGYTEAQVKAIAAEYSVKDGPNDDGEMFDRPAIPSDRFVSPYANEKAARAANNGALPPDLSLMAKARHGGPDYIYSLLTGYQSPPAGTTIPEGMYYNPYMSGGQIAMAPPLSEGVVTYADGTAATVDQMSQDVSAFLMWAAEPHLEERYRMGVMVILFLLAFAAIMYGAKKAVWRDQH